MTPDWQSVISAALGGIGVTGIAKYFLQKSADKLDQIPEKLGEIKSQISAINVQLHGLNELRTLVMQHDRQISRMSAQGKYKNGGGDCLSDGN